MLEPRRILSLLLFVVLFPQRVNATAFEFREDDRVVFLGNSFFERALANGQMETRIALSVPAKKVRFRNLGWDGDTVYGHPRTGGRRRAVFGDAEEGFQRMVKHVNSWSPTVVFLAYGFNESFEEADGIKSFRRQLERLISKLKTAKTRFVIVSPTMLEPGFGSSLQNAKVDEHLNLRNAWILKYTDVLVDVAKKGGHSYVDLTKLTQLNGKQTENGIHLNTDGYELAGNAIASQLELPRPAQSMTSGAAQALRRLIVRKNTLYFHRWRPRNDAFVYGERKDEQKTAQQEPEQFEKFIAAEENQIQRVLRDLEGGK